ncbi:MAG: 16S rRNA (uracil(1498)-N(3))-methyltransferase [Magnetococcales bacterium]|nr:16S rRNA (uracil(1498)-N(3))-methyltransferase [Magnetococcales bacterium]
MVDANPFFPFGSGPGSPEGGEPVAPMVPTADPAWMRIPLSRLPEGGETTLPLASGAKTILASWEVRPGELLTVTDPAGGFHRGRLLGGGEAVTLIGALPPHLEPPCRRTLAQAIPDKERMAWVIEKGVELGATGIRPLMTRRSFGWGAFQPRQDKSATWSRIARRAARQCRRATLPQVLPPMTLSDFLDLPESRETLLFLDLPGIGAPLWRLAPRLWSTPLTLVVGPEGGWDPEEREAMAAVGAIPATLGARVLRTETAGPAALALFASVDEAFTPVPV